ncbi:PhoU domain-containing protein [Faecalitalea cylindroides]
MIFLDSVSDYERISDHAENLAKYVVEEEEKF